MLILLREIYLVGCPKDRYLGLCYFFLYVNDFLNCSKILDFHLFADDWNLFYAHKGLQDLEKITNDELQKVNDWLSANKLSLNVIFHSHQKKINYDINITINGKLLGACVP